MSSISKMNKDELIVEAKNRGLYTDNMESMTKEDIKAILKGQQTSEEKSEEKAEETGNVKVPNHSIYGMRPAIAGAHKTLNKTAIKKDEAIMAGVEETVWSAWKQYVEGEFYDAVRNYFDQLTTYSFTETRQERDIRIKQAESKAWQKWRFCIKAGEESTFHKNMYVEDADIQYFFAFIYDRDGVDGYGQSFVSKGKQVFRKEVEALIGLRMAAARLRSDEETEFLRTYRANKNAIESNSQRLNGRDTDTKHEPGLIEQIAALEKSIEKVDKYNEELMKKFNIPAEEFDTSYVAKMRSDLKELKSAKETAEKNLADAKKYIEEHTDDFEKLTESYSEIEL